MKFTHKTFPSQQTVRPTGRPPSPGRPPLISRRPGLLQAIDRQQPLLSPNTDPRNTPRRVVNMSTRHRNHCSLTCIILKVRGACCRHSQILLSEVMHSTQVGPTFLMKCRPLCAVWNTRPILTYLHIGPCADAKRMRCG